MTTEQKRNSKIKIKKDEQMIRGFEAHIEVLQTQLEDSSLWAEEDSIIEEAIHILVEAKKEAELRVFERWHTVIPF